MDNISENSIKQESEKIKAQEKSGWKKKYVYSFLDHSWQQCPVCQSDYYQWTLKNRYCGNCGHDYSFYRPIKQNGTIDHDYMTLSVPCCIICQKLETLNEYLICQKCFNAQDQFSLQEIEQAKLKVFEQPVELIYTKQLQKMKWDIAKAQQRKQQYEDRQALGEYRDSSYPWWNPTGLNTWNVRCMTLIDSILNNLYKIYKYHYIKNIFDYLIINIIIKPTIQHIIRNLILNKIIQAINIKLNYRKSYLFSYQQR